MKSWNERKLISNFVLSILRKCFLPSVIENWSSNLLWKELTKLTRTMSFSGFLVVSKIWQAPMKNRDKLIEKECLQCLYLLSKETVLLLVVDYKGNGVNYFAKIRYSSEVSYLSCQISGKLSRTTIKVELNNLQSVFRWCSHV